MKMNRVEIKIESLRRFTEVAHFVDQRGFVEYVEKVRDWLKIVPGKYQVGEYGVAELDKLVAAYRADMLTLSELCLAIRDCCRGNNLLFPKVDRVLALVLENAETLAMKYKKNRLYVHVGVAAILTNVVTDNDYKTTQIIDLNKSELRQLADELDSSYSEYFAGAEETLLAIRIDPETTKDELIDTFKFIKDREMGYMSSSHPDTLSRVKRNRDWYWENLNGKKPNQIFNQICRDDDDNTTYDDVSKGIAGYRKFLET